MLVPAILYLLSCTCTCYPVLVPAVLYLYLRRSTANSIDWTTNPTRASGVLCSKGVWGAVATQLLIDEKQVGGNTHSGNNTLLLVTTHRPTTGLGSANCFRGIPR